ncbi:MAG: motility protein A [Clostridia bacterium]|nr:motility protein A [Candidatus Pelethousia sp.]NCB31114.1 motility protein A [Clostridia bacterium]
MGISTILGIVGGFACIIIGILLNGRITDFLDPASIFITLGGTICALIVSYPIPQLLDTLKSLKFAFKGQKEDPARKIQLIIDLANTARKEGLLALENMLEDIPDPFLRKGIMLIVDGSNSELVKSVMETELYYIQERHNRCISVLNAGAGYAPAFGMAGTLIGLIAMLVSLEDASKLGPSMSVALVTTFYGVLIANFFFSPLSRNLKTLSAQEQMIDEMMLEGILSIQDGENPRMIRDKLEAFVSGREIAVLDARIEQAKQTASAERQE